MPGRVGAVPCCLWRRCCSGRLLGRAAWCARGRRPAREPSAPRASPGASPRSPARPRHRPRAPQPGPLVPSGPSTPVGPGRCLEPYSWPRPRAPQPGPLGLPAPSVPVGPDVLMGGCSDDGMFGCALLQTSSIQGVFCVDSCVVVTNVVNPTAYSLKIQVFWRRLTTFVTGVRTRRLKSRWFDDVCHA